MPIKKVIISILLILTTTLFSIDEIVLASSGAYVGTNKELGINYTLGASVYFQELNKRGGIDNKIIILHSLDDEYNPKKTVFNTIEFINTNDPLLLFNYVGTPTTNAILPLLKINEDKNLLLFGNLTGSGAQRTEPYGDFVFNIRSSYYDETTKLVDYFTSTGKRRIGVFYQVDDFGRSAYSGLKDKLEKYGFEIAGEATYKRQESWNESMVSQAMHLKDQDIDAIISIATYEAAAAFIRDARSIDLNIPISNMSFVEVNALIRILKGNDISTENLFFSQVMPHHKYSVLPVVREYREVFKNRGIETNFISLEGYINAKLLSEILIKTPYVINRKNIKKIIEEMEPLDIGLGKRVKFSKNKHNLLKDVYIYQTGINGEIIEVK